MGQTAKPTRHNRTITVDFHDATTYFALLDNSQAFVEFVLAFILSLGFQLIHKTSCSEGGKPDAPLPLCPSPPGWAHHLAHPVEFISIK